MTTSTYKVLGQINPSINTLTSLYTVPANTSTVVSTVSICNQAETASSFRLAIRVNGAALNAKQYINYDTPLPGNDTITLTIGMTLSAGDIISVQAGAATVSFNAFGSEVV